MTQSNRLLSARLLAIPVVLAVVAINYLPSLPWSKIATVVYMIGLVVVISLVLDRTTRHRYQTRSQTHKPDSPKEPTLRLVTEARDDRE